MNTKPDRNSGRRSPINSSGNSFLPGARPHPRWLTVAACLCLAAAVWAVFGQTRRHEFVNFDDPVSVYENPIITRGLNLHGIVQLFTRVDPLTCDWWPLNELSHMLDWQLYGPNAGGHHLTNVLLHAATAMLLFLVLKKMTGAFWRSTFVAAVFAIHPLRVESVAWVTERKDVLSGLFFVLTLWAYARYVQQSKAQSPKSVVRGLWSVVLGPASRIAYLAALFFFACGLLSKSMLVTLPFVLLLLDYWPLGRVERSTFNSQLSTLRQLVCEKVPFLLLSAAGCLMTLLAQGNPGQTAGGIPLSWRIANAVVLYADYLGQMIYPVGLAVVYPYPGTRLPPWKIALALAVLLIISAGVLAWRRRQPGLLVGWLWYVGMLVPVIGLVQGGSTLQIRADRYTYLPQIGLYILVAWGAVGLCGHSRPGRILLRSAAVAVVASLLWIARAQAARWKDSVTLWTHTVSCTSGNILAYNNLGHAFSERGRLDEAIQHYEQALQLNPDYAAARFNLGDALARQGKVAEAVPHYELGLKLKPDYGVARYNLGNALYAQGKFAEAVDQYRRVLQGNPDHAQAHNNLGNALAAQGRLAEAVQHYERTLQLKPDFAEAHNNLGSVLDRQGKGSEAMVHYQQAVQLNPDYAEAHFNLGIGLGRQGKIDEAVRHFQRALDLATARNNPAFADAIRNRLKALPR